MYIEWCFCASTTMQDTLARKKRVFGRLKTISNIYFLYRILLLIILLHARRALSGRHTCIQTH